MPSERRLWQLSLQPPPTRGRRLPWLATTSSMPRERERLLHAQSLSAFSAGVADRLCDAEGSVIAVLGRLMKEAARWAPLDKRLAEVAKRLDALKPEVQDIGETCHDLAETFEADPERLDAVERGARHYRRELDPSLPPDSATINDEEIGIALCLGEHLYDLDHLRAAAQLLSSPRVDAARLCRLAIQERCEPVLLHTAEQARRFAPELQPWAWVRRHLPARPGPRTDALPHWSRLVSHTGVSAHGGPPRTDWLCRHE